LNQSQGARSRAPAGLRTWLDSKWDATKDALLAAISGDRIVAVPKYATRNELGERLNIDSTQLDGKTLATVILEPGEYTEPIPVYDRDPDFHLAGLSRAEAKQLSQDMAQIQVIYFRPYGWLPAIRLEVPHRQAVNLHRRALILEGIARQLFTPAVFEPYPLFLADRMVKSLGVGVNVVEQAISQHVVGEATDAEEALLFLRQHRTEGGRGS
jgi:hypothetical protein